MYKKSLRRGCVTNKDNISLFMCFEVNTSPPYIVKNLVKKRIFLGLGPYHNRLNADLFDYGLEN